jgi:hypothetical protein
VRWEALILPHTLTQAAAAGRFFTFTLGGKPYEYKLESETFVKGTKYRYDFTLSEPGPKITPQPPTSSFDGMTNCYMVAPGDSVTFRVSRAYTFVDGKFTNTLHVDDSSYGGVNDKFDAAVVWADKTDLLTSVTVDDGAGNQAKVTVRANNTNIVGNAVVALKKKSTQSIVWSYHIWVTNYQPDDTNAQDKAVYENKGNTNNNGGHFIFMDRNLGATFAGMNSSASSIGTGLFYQWGRKDPFPDTDGTLAFGSFSRAQTSNSLGTITNTIANPNVLYYNTSSSQYNDWHFNSPNDTLWNHHNNKKTIYDPCPTGWRVPIYTNTEDGGSPWSGLPTTNLTFTYGYKFANHAIYAAAGHRDGMYATNKGKIAAAGEGGYYWGASTTAALGLRYYFTSSIMGLTRGGSKANGMSVRCVRE